MLTVAQEYHWCAPWVECKYPVVNDEDVDSPSLVISEISTCQADYHCCLRVLSICQNCLARPWLEQSFWQWKRLFPWVFAVKSSLLLKWSGQSVLTNGECPTQMPSSCFYHETILLDSSHCQTELTTCFWEVVNWSTGNRFCKTISL